MALTQQARWLSATGRLAEAHALLGEAAGVFRHLSTEQPGHDLLLATVLRNLSSLSNEIGEATHRLRPRGRRLRSPGAWTATIRRRRHAWSTA